MGDYRRGSEWRKWDLHVHTASSFDAYKGEDADALLVKALRENEIVAVAITDHYLIHEERIENLRKLAPEITFFPGVELRTDKVAKNLHLILIFSENKDLKTLREDFDANMIRKNAIYGNDINKIHWTYESIIEFANEQGAIVTIHAGGKEDGIEKAITNATPVEEAVKEYISNNVHFFEVGKKKDIEDYKKIVFRDIDEKPIIMCSDNHDPRDYTIKESLWIKADPTFEGLIQCIYQPAERVFVGSVPPKLDKAEKNKRSYIRSINVCKKQTALNSEEWFDFSLPINCGLTAIIGNKGSGKSALSDIIGHICHCNSINDASFLNEQRFRRPPKKLANDYEGNITWLDKQKDEVDTLGVRDNCLVIENAQYLPQKYIENVCNELGNQFQREINRVIFSYIEPTERGDAKDLNELIEIKSKGLSAREAEIRNKLELLNNDIINFEEKSTSMYLEQLNAALKKRESDLKRHEQNIPKEVAKPDREPSNEYTERMSSLNEQIVVLEKQIKDEVLALTKANTDIDSLENTVDQLDLIKESIEKYNVDIVIIANDFSLKLDDLKIKYSLPNKIIESELIKLKKVKNDKQLLLDKSDSANAEISLYKKLEVLQEEKAKLVATTNSKEKAYQKYLDDLKEWKENKKKIEGDSDLPDSINFYKAEIAYVTRDLKKEYSQLKRDRLDNIRLLHKIKQDKAAIYESIYTPIEKQIHGLLTDTDDEMQFSITINMVNKEAPSAMLDYVDKGYSGIFHGKANAQRKITEIVNSHNFNNADGACKFIEEVLQCVYENIDQSSQIVKDKQGFYDYVTSIDYLDVEYNLKMNNKCLEELSAGERGSVLLMFYLALCKEESPIIIDQPEDNLDNQSVYSKLVPYILEAKKKRQIIIVTHNPNIAVACDAEQIIYCSIDKNTNKISYECGSIENKEIRDRVIEVLEGTMPAFDLRRLKYTLKH